MIGINNFAKKAALMLCLVSVPIFGTETSLFGTEFRFQKPASSEEVAKTVTRGIDFLVDHQNDDGSWGSHVFKTGVMIAADIPGAHHAFRAASTAICVMALIEAQDSRPEVAQALARGEQWLLKKLPKLRRCSIGQLYNVWGHSYGLQALVRMHNKLDAEDPKREEIRTAIQEQIDLLDRYAAVDGGWGYYGRAATQQPYVDAPSFTTATALIALYEAKQLGFKLPERTINKAVTCLDRQRLPGFTYVYSDGHRRSPLRPIHLLPGSLGRSQVCNLALRFYGNKLITDDVLCTWLENLLHHNFWLDVGRKTIIPHESHAQVAGYFFYYGYFYAACCLEQLPQNKRDRFAMRMASVICERQEPDGCWFDYPLYSYHRAYATGFAILTLLRCQNSSGVDAKEQPVANSDDSSPPSSAGL